MNLKHQKKVKHQVKKIIIRSSLIYFLKSNKKKTKTYMSKWTAQNYKAYSPTTTPTTQSKTPDTKKPIPLCPLNIQKQTQN